MINNVSLGKRESPWKLLAKTFISPLNILFCGLAIILVFMGEADPAVIIFISLIVIVYNILRLEQVSAETQNSHTKLHSENNLSD